MGKLNVFSSFVTAVVIISVAPICLAANPPGFQYPPFDNPLVVAGEVVSVEPILVKMKYGDETTKALITLFVKNIYLGECSDTVRFTSNNILYEKPGDTEINFTSEAGSAWFIKGDKVLLIIGDRSLGKDGTYASVGELPPSRLSAFWSRFLPPESSFEDTENVYRRGDPLGINSQSIGDRNSDGRASSAALNSSLSFDPDPTSAGLLGETVSSILDFYWELQKKGIAPSKKEVHQ